MRLFDLKFSKFVVVPMFLCFFVVFSAVAGPKDYVSLENYIEKSIDEWDVPGLSVAIVKSDKVIYTKGFGYLEEGGSDKVDENTIFATGSIGKSLTAALIASLQDQNVLSLDDPIIKYLPNFRLSDLESTHQVTFKHSLSNTSGVPGGLMLGAGYMMGTPPEVVVDLIKDGDLDARPGEKFAYSNAMFTVAAEAAETTTGKGYSTLLSENIFEPLNMDRSGVFLNQTAENNFALPHMNNGKQSIVVPYHQMPGIAAAGSHYSTASDLGKFVRMMLNKGRFGNQVVLTESSSSEIQKMTRLFEGNEFLGIRMMLESVDPSFHVQGIGYSYGLNHFIYDGALYFAHGGRTGGMSSWMMWSPEKDIGVVVMANEGNVAFPTFLAFSVVNHALELPFDDVLGRAKPIYSNLSGHAGPPSVKRKRESVLGYEELVGQYHNSIGSFEISQMESGELEVHLGELKHRGTLEAHNGPFYWAKWDNATLIPVLFRAVMNPEGTIVGLEETPGALKLFPTDPLFKKSNSK